MIPFRGKKFEAFALWQTGVGIDAIEKRTGLKRRTLQRYISGEFKPYIKKLEQHTKNPENQQDSGLVVDGVIQVDYDDIFVDIPDPDFIEIYKHFESDDSVLTTQDGKTLSGRDVRLEAFMRGVDDLVNTG